VQTFRKRRAGLSATAGLSCFTTVKVRRRPCCRPTNLLYFDVISLPHASNAESVIRYFIHTKTSWCYLHRYLLDIYGLVYVQEHWLLTRELDCLNVLHSDFIVSWKIWYGK